MNSTTSKACFVFDLDETIMHTSLIPDPPSQEDLKLFKHKEVYELLSKIDKSKAWVFLLTNNADSLYVAFIDTWLEAEFGSTGAKGYGFFDYVLDRSPDSPRNFLRGGRDATKSLVDVQFMLRMVKDPGAEDLASVKGRTYFFDDQEGHVLQGQIAPEHMFLIKPEGNDFTSLTPFLGQQGGRRLKRLAVKLRRLLSRKSSRRRSKKLRRTIKIGRRRQLRLPGPKNSHHAL